MMPGQVDSSGFYGFLSVRSVIEFNEGWGMNLIGIFPSVVTFRVALPFDQILQGLAPPPGPMGAYLFHFVFCFSINQVQWWSGKIGAV
jgi:hypothetical protein